MKLWQWLRYRINDHLFLGKKAKYQLKQFKARTKEQPWLPRVPTIKKQPWPVEVDFKTQPPKKQVFVKKIKRLKNPFHSVLFSICNEYMIKRSNQLTWVTIFIYTTLLLLFNATYVILSLVFRLLFSLCFCLFVCFFPLRALLRREVTEIPFLVFIKAHQFWDIFYGNKIFFSLI